MQAPQPTPENRPSTRAEAIEQERLARSQNLYPDIPPPMDRFLVWERDNRVFEKFTVGYQGFRAQFGHMITGSGLAFGVGYFRRDLRRNSLNLGLSAEISTKFFQRYEAEVSTPLAANDRLLLGARGVWLNYPSVNFYGLGPDTEKGGRTDYRLRDVSGDGILGVRPVEGLLVGVSGGYARFSTGPGTDDRFASTTDVFTPAELPGLSEVNKFIRYGAFADYDWRDRPFSPTSGGRYLFRYTRYNNDSNRPYDFRRYEADIEQYFSIFNRRRIFVVRGNATLADPDSGNVVPFYLQPTIGGPYTLRGFRSFRFTDNNALALTGEYRWEAYTGLDMALFVDAGKVFPKASQLNLHDLEYAGGFGFRFNARNKIFLRIDTGFSREGFQIWFRLGDVFAARRLGVGGTQPIY